MMFASRKGQNSAAGRCRSNQVMKLFMRWVMSAGVVMASAAANAQVLAPYDIDRSPYSVVSDLRGPYAGLPQPGRYAPSLLPPQEVYTVLRESGFSPLGAPQRRGFVYTIVVIDRGGEDGRLVIDARNGRIIRFMPAYRMGDNLNDAMRTTYGPVVGSPPGAVVRNGSQPALSPQVVSRVAPTPLPKPSRPISGEARPAVAKSAAEPAQRSAAVQAKPASAQPAPQLDAPAVLEPKPAPSIMPTQEMPKAQGLD
jgi:hypothetical protein